MDRPVSGVVVNLASRFEQPALRRQLNREEVDALITAWHYFRAVGERPGELWAFLGWTPTELDRFQLTRVCPRGG